MKCHRSPIGTCIWAFFTPSYPAQLTSRCDRNSLRVLGIENKNQWNLKDLRRMRMNAKSLKRNKRARKGILIAPSKLPRFSSVVDILKVDFFYSLAATKVGFGPK